MVAAAYLVGSRYWSDSSPQLFDDHLAGAYNSQLHVCLRRNLLFPNRYRIAAAFSLVFLLLSACSPGQSSPPVADEPTTIKIVALPFLSYGPIYIADEEGYFADQNITLEYSQFEHTSDGLVAMGQRQVDVVAGFVTIGVLNAMATEDQIKLVADKGHADPAGCPAEGLMVRTDIAEMPDISNPDTLKDLTYSVSEADVEEYLLDIVLGQSGLSSADVRKENIGSRDEPDAFRNGSIDAALPSEPWVTRITNAGVASMWIPVKEIVPDLQWAGIYYGPTLLQENPDAARRFMIAYLRGVRQFNEGATDRNIEIISTAMSIDAEELMQVCWAQIRNDGSMNVDTLLDFAAWAVDQGYLDTAPTADQIADPGFAQEAAQELDAAGQ
jgi:NitT/TauT family transport system substrate-binding protein